MEELQLDYSELQKTIEELLPEKFPVSFEQLIESFTSGEAVGLQQIGKEIGTWLLQSVTFPIEQGMKLLFLILFSALFSNLSKAFARDSTSHFGFLCVYFLMAVQAALGFTTSLQIVKEGMENLCEFVSVLLPTYCVSIAFVTGSITAVGYYQGTAFLLTFFQYLATYCLIPLSQVYLMLSFASCMQKKPMLEKSLELIVSLFSWVRKTLFGIAIAFGAVQGILCPAIDSLKRTAVIRSASAIPVVGSLIDGMWETVLGAGNVLKNAVGIGGVVLLFLIGAIPLASLGLQCLMYRILAAVTEPITQEMTGHFLSHAGTAQKLLFEALFLGMILFLLLLVVMTKITRV